jgi:hypothetical protein
MMPNIAPILPNGELLLAAIEEGAMKKIGGFVQFFMCLAIVGFGPWNRTNLFAQRILGGAELENACQTYADKAVKLAKQWEERECNKKLGLAQPQLMDTDRTWHYNRCKGSVGTGIDANLKSMEDDLRKCPGGSDKDKTQIAGTGIAGTGDSGGDNSRRDNPGWGNRRRDTPPNNNLSSGGDIWDITVVNSADLARSFHVYRIPSLNGMFTSQNLNPAGGPELRGQMNGSVFEAVMTDNTGYRANFIGHGTMSGEIEGTGCDNRNRSFSFLMKRR